MPRYFSEFPKLAYTREGITTLATNILTRLDIVRGTLDNVSLFYEYSIQEGDTPEMIASKYYNDAELHWVVLLFNGIVDPYYDWPMTYQQFELFLNEKYGDAATAMSTHHHYEKIVKTTDNFSGTTTTNVYIIDQETYSTLVESNETKSFSTGGSVNIDISKKDVDCYTYEQDLDDSKRIIKLVKNTLIPDIKKQFKTLMSA